MVELSLISQATDPEAMDHRASMISQQKQRRLVISNSDTNPLEQLASAFCAIDDDETQMISYIDFQSAERYSDDPQSSSDHQQAIPIRSSISTMINKAEDHTLVSVVNPDRLWRNNAKRYWSQQGSLLSLDHSKLLSEANLNLKASHLALSISLISSFFWFYKENKFANFPSKTG